jgi:DNA gyrase subunit A
VRIFQQAEDRATARKRIEAEYHLTPIQSDVIASMTLSQVTRLDANKYAKEREALQERIAELERLLGNHKLLVSALKKEMQQLIKQFGDERRTIIDVEGQVHAPIEEVASLHEREPVIIAGTRAGAVKALPSDVFTPKGKNGNGIYTPARGDEQLAYVLHTTSQDYLLCVASSGRIFQVATHRIPQGTRSAKGEPWRNILKLAPAETIVSVVPVEAYDEDRYLVIFSKLGKVKKSPLSEYKTADVDGVPDMKLAEGDRVVKALLSRGRGEYLVTTDAAQTLRFSDEQVRSQGRVGQGVAAMSLSGNAAIVDTLYLDSEYASTEVPSLFVLTEQGMAKRVPLSQYPQKGRATAGVVTMDLQKGDHILSTLLLADTNTVLVAWMGSSGEQAITLRAADIKMFSRAHKGSALVDGRALMVVLL